tara:strand:- start:129 stop:257 length:129 start_codon:yes stop_codon:yes gene_type:complete
MPPKKLSKWNIHLAKVFKDGKKKDSKYTFVEAMKEAKKSYVK